MKDSVEQLNECYRKGECQKHPDVSESASTPCYALLVPHKYMKYHYVCQSSDDCAKVGCIGIFSPFKKLEKCAKFKPKD